MLSCSRPPPGLAASLTRWRRRWTAPVPRSSPSARVADLLHAFTPATVETVEGALRWRPDNSRPAAPGAGADLPNGTAVVIATSGSTGEPKGAQLSADALLASARASLDRIGAA